MAITLLLVEIISFLIMYIEKVKITNKQILKSTPFTILTAQFLQEINSNL